MEEQIFKILIKHDFFNAGMPAKEIATMMREFVTWCINEGASNEVVNMTDSKINYGICIESSDEFYETIDELFTYFINNVKSKFTLTTTDLLAIDIAKEEKQ